MLFLIALSKLNYLASENPNLSFLKKYSENIQLTLSLVDNYPLPPCAKYLKLTCPGGKLHCETFIFSLPGGEEGSRTLLTGWGAQKTLFALLLSTKRRMCSSISGRTFINRLGGRTLLTQGGLFPVFGVNN